MGKWNVSRSAKALDTQNAAVLYRDNYRCVSCGATDNLTIDHIEPMRYNQKGHKPGRYRQANLRTLCVSCHKWLNKPLDTEPVPLRVEAYREFNQLRGWSASPNRSRPG